MTPPAAPTRYKQHRCPGEILRHGVWLSSRVPLSDRDVQALLCARGIDVTQEAIRQWCLPCGQDDAPQLKRRRAQPGDTWPLDEVFLTINGKRQDLWRAVAQDDHVLAILGQRRRHQHAAQKFFRTLLQGLQDVSRVIVTEKGKRDGAAQREIRPGVGHRQRRALHHRCENAHRPPRQRAQRMQGCKSAGHAPRFLAAYGPLAHHFRPRRHGLSAPQYRQEMRQRFARWAAMPGTERAASRAGRTGERPPLACGASPPPQRDKTPRGARREETEHGGPRVAITRCGERTARHAVAE